MPKDELKAAAALGWRSDWENAPRDGTEIEVNSHDLTEPGTTVWSERPVCMGGDRVGGCEQGWATGPESGTDTNLPMDQPDLWRFIECADA